MSAENSAGFPGFLFGCDACIPKTTLPQGTQTAKVQVVPLYFLYACNACLTVSVFPVRDRWAHPTLRGGRLETTSTETLAQPCPKGYKLPPQVARPSVREDGLRFCSREFDSPG